MVNGKTVTVSLALEEGVACNTMFSWPFLKKIKASIMTDNNDLISGLMGEQFRLEMMVPQRAKEPPKTSDGIPVSLPFSIQVKQENTKNRSSRVGRVELKNMVLHATPYPRARETVTGFPFTTKGFL